MKVILIRHARVKMNWPKTCTSSEYEEACQRYNEADIEAAGEKQRNADGYVIITSSEKRARQTAQLLFGDADIQESDLLREVPIAPFCSTNHKLPRWMFDILGRLQWAAGVPGQPESRRETKERARKAAALIARQTCDCVVISHGFFIRVLLKEYSRGRGYTISRASALTIPPLSRIRITMTKDHCGNCAHNCTLDNPGCNIGKAKARGE